MQKWQNMIPYEYFYSKGLSIKNTLHSESSAIVNIWRMLPRAHIINVPLKSTTILLSGSPCQSFPPPAPPTVAASFWNQSLHMQIVWVAVVLLFACCSKGIERKLFTFSLKTKTPVKQKSIKVRRQNED